MIESVALHGYEATTVADLVAYAGVSRRALYEHYRDKYACLQETHETLIRRACVAVVKAWSAHHGWSNQLHGACKELFEQANAYPAGACLTLIDSPTIRPGGLARTQFANLAFERLLHASVHSVVSHPGPPHLSARAIVGGIRHVLFTRVRDRRTSELASLADEVIDWVELYRAPAKRGAILASRIQPAAIQPHRAHPGPATDEWEARILRAMAELLSEVGYATITDSQLARRARIPTQALHRSFASKEQCGEALIESLNVTALGAARAAAADIAWPARVGVGLRAYLAWLGVNTAAAKLLFITAFDLGYGAAVDVVRPISELLDLLMLGAPEPRRARRIARQAITGALWSTILAQIAAGTASQLPDFTDRLAPLVLTPYIDPEEGIARAYSGPRASVSHPRPGDSWAAIRGREP